jgi:hypothetical protein
MPKINELRKRLYEWRGTGTPNISELGVILLDLIEEIEHLDRKLLDHKTDPRVHNDTPK